MLLSNAHVAEEQPNTQQLPEAATEREQQETPPVPLFPSVTEEERNKVIEAYRQGIQRREICSYLHWGNAKYTTIVKPVLDAHEGQEKQRENTEK
jgi:hypothetical protein